MVLMPRAALLTLLLKKPHQAIGTVVSLPNTQNQITTMPMTATVLVFMRTGPLIKDKLSLSSDGNFQGNDESDYIGGEGQKSGSSESEKKVKKLGTELVWSVDENNDIGLRYDFSGSNTPQL